MKRCLRSIFSAGLLAIGLTAGHVHAELDKGYGVVIGKPVDKFLFTGGKWPHYHIKVQVPDPANPGETLTYDSALDLFSTAQGVGVEVAHREVDMKPQNAALYNGIFSLPDGYHDLPYHHQPDAPTSGALDFQRHKGILQDIKEVFWDQTPLIDAAGKTVPIYDKLLENAVKVYIFGEPYDSGLGVHNVHANQGNFLKTEFTAANGIWQDGAVIIEYADSPEKFPCVGCNEMPYPHGTKRRIMLMTRFQIQSDFADENGTGIKPFSNTLQGTSFDGTSLISYGPIFAREVQFTGLAAGGDNPEVLIKNGSAPTAQSYDIKGTSLVRYYHPTGDKDGIYIAVHPSVNNLGWTYGPFFWKFGVETEQ